VRVEHDVERVARGRTARAAKGRPAAAINDLWYKNAVIYCLSVGTFMDANGDGIGDFEGLMRRLDYLHGLGITAIWLMPFQTSPGRDDGYDVSDYYGVNPAHGTLGDFVEFTHGAKQRGIRVLIDLVVNHTSDEHPWFQEARRDPSSKYRDWYVWSDKKPAHANQGMVFPGVQKSTWTYDSEARAWYFHRFYKWQPDLNTSNPHVQAEILKINEAIAGLRRVLDEFPDRVLLGEIYLPIERLVAYYGRELEGTHLPFNFTLLQTRWRARDIAKLIEEYEAALPRGGWPNWVLGNHDQPRIAGRVGREQARIAAMLLLTLRGTPTIYYGDEIGIPQVPIPPDRVCDPFERNVPGLGCGRDGARTPMQWDASPHAGFSPVEPWLPVAPGFETDNVECERLDPTSIYNLHRRLIAVRRRSPSLRVGHYRPIVASGDLLVFVREYESERTLIGLNLGGEAIALRFPDRQLRGEILVSSAGDREGALVTGDIALRGNEGVVMALARDVAVPPSIR
jgi:alpha-glucosidase